jgi:thymidylate kinase
LVTGAGPGLGKSTLSQAITKHLETAGLSVQAFREMEIENHPAFVQVMKEFITSGEASRTTLLEAADSYLKGVDGTAQVIVLDALFAYLPSLLAWGDTDVEILDFFDQMAGLLTNFKVIEIHLTGDVKAGLKRAAKREGGDWLAEHITKVSGYRGAPKISTLEDAVDYLNALALRSISLLTTTPWAVAFVNADDGMESATAEALNALSRSVL